MTIAQSRWFKGILGAAISGGAAAAVPAAMVFHDPKDWAEVGRALAVIGGAFLLGAAVSLTKYLVQHPVPEELANQEDLRK